MTCRPERIKATKLYVTSQKPESYRQSDKKKDQLVKDSEPYIEIKAGQVQGTDKNMHGSTYPDVKSNRSNGNEAVSKPYSDVVEALIKTPKDEKKEMNDMHSNGKTKSQLPNGYVTRKQMEERVNNRMGNGKNNSKEENKVGTLNGFVTEIEQRMVSRKTIEYGTPSECLETGSGHKSKTDSKLNMAVVRGVNKGQESHIKHRKTKTTKISSTYIEHETPVSMQHKLKEGEKGNCHQSEYKNDQKAKHFFSKLENKSEKKTKSSDGGYSKDSQLTIQHQGKSSKVAGKALALPVKKKTERESIKDTDGLMKDKNENSQETKESLSIKSASTRKSSSTVTPRMTSTAIAKPMRGHAKANTMGIKMDSVKILIMNAHGKSDKGGTPAERRRSAIQNVVLKYMPNIVLFQEFSWVGITGKTWAKSPLPEHFIYKGHYEASIMYNSTCITVQDLPASDIDTILSGLQRNSNNRLKRTFPTDFNPVARMCLSRVTAPTRPGLDFICISWHGKSNGNGGGRMKELKKIEYFEYWMEFLRNIREKYKLPILAAGDYNVDMYSIEKFVQSPFKLCKYEASMRRTLRGIVDFCIVTNDLEFSDISWVNLERDTTVFHVNGILDHDPVVGSLAVSALGATDVTLGIGKKKSWPSPIAKHK